VNILILRSILSGRQQSTTLLTEILNIATP